MSEDFPEMPSKRCIRCGETKLIMHFGRAKKAKDGIQPVCRMCLADANAAARMPNPVPAGSLGGWGSHMQPRNGRRFVRALSEETE